MYFGWKYRGIDFMKQQLSKLNIIKSILIIVGHTPAHKYSKDVSYRWEQAQRRGIGSDSGSN